jgi:hypothetical protein
MRLHWRKTSERMAWSALASPSSSWISGKGTPIYQPVTWLIEPDTIIVTAKSR